MHTWTLWYPKAASTGLLHARARIDPADAVLVHAAPEYLTVEVQDEDGQMVAFAQDLQRTEASPMTLLRREGDVLVRVEVWPTDADIGRTVILPGGEAGTLKAWWHADDRKEWRWQIELYNSMR